jgi:hypothetical protein
MIRQKAISDRLMLGMIFLGLNVLCFLGIAHGRHIVHHTRVNYSHIPAHSSRRAGSSRSDSDSVATMVVGHLDHAAVDHAPKATLSKGTPRGNIHAPVVQVTQAFRLIRPDERMEPLADENVIALGSAPRAPGLGRGPPITA